MESNNGGERQAGPRYSTITISKDWDTFHMDVKMTVPTLQDAKGMLQQALDRIDAQIRIAAVQQLQAEAAEEARVAAILAKGKGAFQQ